MTQNGHLVFKSGVNHNISFQAVSGGFINIGKEDLNMIIKTVSHVNFHQTQQHMPPKPTQHTDPHNMH